MDARTVTITLFLASALAGCGGIDLPLAAPTTSGLPPAQGPELTAERVDGVLAESAELCETRDVCEEPDALTGMLWSYPDMQVPDSIWRFPTNERQEVISVGITSIFDPGDPNSTDVERGNTTYYPFDQDP